MRRTHIALLSLLAVALAACSRGTGATAGTQPSPTPAGPVATDPGPASTPVRVAVALTDALRMEPGAITVAAGVPVTFVVTNTGVLEHEFYLGDEAAQAAHEGEMLEMGGMTHDEPEGIAVSPGETKELTYTFMGPGQSLAGCHVAGHYAGGMKASITIEA